MNNQKKGTSKLNGFLARRQFRYGGYATVLTAIVVAVVILLNVAIGMIENNWALSIDVTAINVTDFDEQTERVLSEVDSEVHVYTLYQASTSSALRIQVEEVLNKYRAMNNNITVENIDPVKEPSRVSGYAGDTSLSEGAIIVTNGDESRVKLIDRADYYYYYTSSYNSQTYTLFDLESKMTGALLYVTSDETPRVFYLTGHDELDAESYCTYLTQQLEGQNYDVATLNLVSDTDVTLEAGDTVVIINPLRDLSDAEYETLRAWLAEGGRMMFVLQPDTDESVLKNFAKLLDYYQLSFGDGNIMEDPSSTTNWNGDYYTLVPNLSADSEVTSALAENGAYLMLPYSRPINAVSMPESGLQFANVLTTSDKAVVMAEDGSSSMPGIQTVAMTMLKQNQDNPDKDIRIALIGNYYALADTNLLNYSYNMNFTMSMFNWLVNRQNGVEITQKLISSNTLAIPDSATAWTLAAIIVVAIPLVVLVAGIVVWIKRRSL